MRHADRLVGDSAARRYRIFLSVARRGRENKTNKTVECHRRVGRVFAAVAALALVCATACACLCPSIHLAHDSILVIAFTFVQTWQRASPAGRGVGHPSLSLTSTRTYRAAAREVTAVWSTSRSDAQDADAWQLRLLRPSALATVVCCKALQDTDDGICLPSLHLTACHQALRSILMRTSSPLTRFRVGPPTPSRSWRVLGLRQPDLSARTHDVQMMYRRHRHAGGRWRWCLDMPRWPMTTSRATGQMSSACGSF